MVFAPLEKAMLVQVVGASISAAIFAVTPTAANIGSFSSGKCRKISIDSGGTGAVVADYHTLWNATSTALAVDDIVPAMPIEDGTGGIVMACVGPKVN